MGPPDARYGVRVEPIGLDLDIAPGETLMAAAARQGYVWPTRCGGEAVCRVCQIVVTDGLEDVLPPNDAEAAALRPLADTRLGRPEVRLACQLQVRGLVTVQKRGWNPSIGGR